MEKIKYCIQCTDKLSGKVGCFAYDIEAYERGEGRKAISEVFPSSSELFLWAKKEGYKSVGYYSFEMAKEQT